jgi:hypothetical protein
MTKNDHIYSIPGFNLRTQKQVLRSIWRAMLGTFKHVLDTIPGEMPNCPKVQQRMLYCLEEIVDVDGHQLYFASKEDLSCQVNHHQTSHLTSLTTSQFNNHSSGATVPSVGRVVQHSEPRPGADQGSGTQETGHGYFPHLQRYHNLDNLSWSGATSKFLTTPQNQATSVQSPHYCPPVWIGIREALSSDTRRCGPRSGAPTFSSTTPQNHATY